MWKGPNFSTAKNNANPLEKKKAFAFIVEKDFRNLSIKYVHASRSLPLEMLATHFVQLYIATSNLLKINKSQQSATKAQSGTL